MLPILGFHVAWDNLPELWPSPPAVPRADTLMSWFGRWVVPTPRVTSWLRLFGGGAAPACEFLPLHPHRDARLRSAQTLRTARAELPPSPPHQQRSPAHSSSSSAAGTASQPGWSVSVLGSFLTAVQREGCRSRSAVFPGKFRDGGGRSHIQRWIRWSVDGAAKSKLYSLLTFHVWSQMEMMYNINHAQRTPTAQHHYGNASEGEFCCKGFWICSWMNKLFYECFHRGIIPRL